MTRAIVSFAAAAVLLGAPGAYAQAPEPVPPTATAGEPEPGAAGPAVNAAGDESVVLNFEGADVREVIHSLADALGINYQIDPRIQGQVTIRTTDTISKEDLFPVFNQILRSNGIASVRVGDIYQIIPVAEAKTKAIIPATPPDGRRVARQDAFVIEVVRIEHVAAQEMVNVIQPFITPGGDVIPYARANLLIITDLSSNVGRLKDLVHTFDRDAFRDLRARVYKIEHANIEELGQELIAIMDTYGVTPASAEERGVYVIPLPRLSSVVIVAFNPTIFAEIDRWMKILDVPPEEGAGRSVHVYAVENAKAADLASILSELYGGGGAGGGGARTPGYTPFGTRQRGGVTRAGQPAPAVRAPVPVRPGQALQSFDNFEPLQQFDDSGGLGGVTRGARGRRGGRGGIGGVGGIGTASGMGGVQQQGTTGYVLAGGEPGDIFRQEVRIVADEVTNSLVILATKKDYDDIREVLRRLDIVPRQVLIEVLVAEVDLGEELKFGVEHAVAEERQKFVDGEPSDDIFDNLRKAFGLASEDITPAPESGVFGVITDNKSFAVVLNAMASKDKLKVLSSPHLMTADNHEAHILVGKEVPIITTQQNAYGVQTDSTTNILQNIQYRDTGVSMTVLPQVNSEGLVNMQIRQEVSQIASTATGGINSPTFSTRESETTVVVQSGETIVIGGIIDDTVDRTRTGVPFLMDIPVLGRLFRIDKDSVRRTELIVLVTPHVVRDRQESRTATAAFRSRLEGMRRDLERREREHPDYGGPRAEPPDRTTPDQPYRR